VICVAGSTGLSVLGSLGMLQLWHSCALPRFVVSHMWRLTPVLVVPISISLSVYCPESRGLPRCHIVMLDCTSSVLLFMLGGHNGAAHSISSASCVVATIALPLL
jgi:hypothetical protein